MLIALTWLICIPAAYGLWLVLTEEPVDRVSPRELDAANEYAQHMDARHRARLKATRGQDRYEWSVRFREAEHLRFVRRFREFWDGEVA